LWRAPCLIAACLASASQCLFHHFYCCNTLFDNISLKYSTQLKKDGNHRDSNQPRLIDFPIKHRASPFWFISTPAPAVTHPIMTTETESFKKNKLSKKLLPQNRFVRIATRPQSHVSAAPLVHKLQMFTIYDINISLTCIFMFKILLGESPP